MRGHPDFPRWPTTELHARVLWQLRQPMSRSCPALRLELSREHLRIYLREKCAMQSSNNVRHRVFIDHESYINLRCALRDHVNVGFRYGAKDLGGNPGGALDVFPH